MRNFIPTILIALAAGAALAAEPVRTDFAAMTQAIKKGEFEQVTSVLIARDG